MNSLSKDSAAFEVDIVRVCSMTLSIKQKLIFIILIICSLAVTLAGVTMIAYQYVGFKSQMVENLTIQAQMLGINSQTALAFDDPKDAMVILSSLKADSSIAYASLLSKNGDVFASYRRMGFTSHQESVPVGRIAVFTENWLLVVYDIRLGGDQREGKIFVQSDLNKLDTLLRQSITAVSIIVLVVLAISYLLSYRLQRIVSDPILQLTNTASYVTTNQDYSVSVEVKSHDELGELSKAFNMMMAHIEERDRALALHRNNLEELVEKRTTALEKAYAEIVSKERLAALGQLTATVAHEIRNPLGTVRTSVFAIGDAIRRKRYERTDRMLQLAERNIQRCDNIISELLNYTRKRELRLKVVDVDLWLGEFLDQQEIPKNVLCRRNFNASLLLPFDQEHLRRAIANIVTNGLQALQEKGGDDLVLTVSTKVVDERLEIEVVDNGPGISDKVYHRIFEPLFSTKGFGVGLGLSIVEGIMIDHQGGVTVGSEWGVYTSVMMWLPTNLEKNTETTYHRMQRNVDNRECQI